MDSFRGEDHFRVQIASALPCNITGGVTGNYPGQILTQACAQKAFQSHPGLGGRELYSKEQWEAQKPIIRQHYNIENMPFKRVIDILRTEHKFSPTKRQFYRKISDWGFEKNIKDKEMRSLVQDLTQRKNIGEDLSITLRGQQIDPVKIQRWRKRQGTIKDNARSFSSSLSIDYSPLDLSAEATEPSRVTDDSKTCGFDHWNLNDVPGTPWLSHLFEALKIECEGTIPPLDLTSLNLAGVSLSTQDEESDVEVNGNIDAAEWVDFSTGPISKDIAKYSREVFRGSDTFSTNSNPDLAALSFSEWSFREWDFSRGQPLKSNISHIIGLSPFPALSGGSLYRTSHQGNSSPLAGSQFWQDAEIEWKTRVQKLKRILGGENPNTLVAMQKLGRIYEKQYKFRQAERLYRQIVISHKNTLGFKHFTTLNAYLDVVFILRDQGALLQALKIHEFIHDTIRQFFAQDSSLTLRSNVLKTSMIYRYGKLNEADKLIRQTLQIRLHTIGPRCIITLYDMTILSRILLRSQKFDESEQLLRITLHLYQVLEGPYSQNSLVCFKLLMDVLQYQGRYDACRDLAMTIMEQFGTSIGLQYDALVCCLYKVAACARYQGDDVESERLMRIVLAKQIEIFGEKHPDTCGFWRGFSITLSRMGRHSEAATLLERSYEGFAKSYGMSHGETLASCRKLGETYASLGRYEDAIGLLQRTIHDARKPEEKPTLDLLDVISDLGVLFRKAGRYAEAIPLHEECLNGFVEISGLSDRWTLYTIDELGRCYEKLGRYSDAFALYEQSINQIRSLKGDEHPALTEISGWITKLREFLAARGEEADETREDSDSIETSVEEALIGEQNGDTDNGLAKTDIPPAEEDWMGEWFDFDLSENVPSDTETSNEDARENKM